MPLALPELQAALAAHLAGAERSDLLAEVVGDAIPAAARLRVYRHHVLESLGAALAATFPTVQVLVGPDFFRAMARTYIAGTLPIQPVLTEYGADFPAFVTGHEPAGGLPYLADVAHLDWALNLAFHAPEGARLTAADLAALPADQLPLLRLVLAAGTALVTSRYPLDCIWSAAQPDASLDAVDLDSGGVDLLVLRRPDDAAFVSLSAGEAAFVHSLAGGRPLEAAAMAADRVDSGFDLSASFARLLDLGAFAVAQ